MTRHHASVPHRLDRIPASARAALVSRPIIAIVGRPNVGKSTLFNRLAGARLAIVHDEPGVTRDRHYADAFGRGVEYTLIDTGGYDPDSDDPMRKGIARHVLAAIEEADVVICVLDATINLTEADREAVQLLRSSKRPVLYAANKADSPHVDPLAYEIYRLGVAQIYPVSALHGRGMSELEEAMIKAIPPKPDEVPDPFAYLGEDLPRVALVGRPNAGKSSLLNRLSGEERSLVDDRPGTTRDTVDALVRVTVKTAEGTREQPLVLLDTAGIRKKSKVNETVEALSVMRAVRAIERSEIVVVMCDAIEGVAEQDAKIAGLAVDRGRAIVIALNKCDELDAKQQAKAEEIAREKLSFIPWAPIVRMSVKTGRGVSHLAEVITATRAAWTGRVTTGQLNRFFAEVLATHPPPTMGGRYVRLYFITQAQSRPPTFIIVTNEPNNVHFSYQRYILNQIRERFGFQGTPLKVRYREKRKRARGEGKGKGAEGVEEMLESDLGGDATDGVLEVDGLDEREVERLAQGKPAAARDEEDDPAGDAEDAPPKPKRAPRAPRTSSASGAPRRARNVKAVPRAAKDAKAGAKGAKSATPKGAMKGEAADTKKATPKPRASMKGPDAKSRRAKTNAPRPRRTR